jgi:hypothetical protein
MRKLLAVVKREYFQRVRTKFFVIMTVLGPFMLVVFTIVPGLLFSVKAGGDTRIAIVDQTEGMKLYDSIRNSLLNNNLRGENDSPAGISRDVNSKSKDRLEKTGKSLKGSFSVEPANSSGPSMYSSDRWLQQPKRVQLAMLVVFSIDGRFVYSLSGHPQSKLILCILGIDVSILLTDHDDRADRFSDPASLADSPLARNWLRKCRAPALARIQDLSHRHVDVWQEGHNSRSDALGQAGMNKRVRMQWSVMRQCLNRWYR